MKVIPKSLRFLLLLSVLFATDSSNLGTLSDRKKQELLTVEYYSLEFNIFTDVKSLDFGYWARTELHFDVASDVDELLFDCQVAFVRYVEVLFEDKTPMEDLDMRRDYHYFRIAFNNGTLWKVGHYALIAYVDGPILENPFYGIYYTLHYDRLKKNKQANIFIDFLPHRAPFVIMCIDDVSKPSDIHMTFHHEDGYHPYFMKHTQLQNYSIHGTYSQMFTVQNLPICFVSAYLTQNLLITQGVDPFSASISTERNHINQFSEEYRYVLDIWFEYVRQWRWFGPNKLALKYQDMFVHLVQNKSTIVAIGEVETNLCLMSMSYALQFTKNTQYMGNYMASCIASNHFMVRRFPRYWDVWYITLGLRDLYGYKFRMDVKAKRPSYSEFIGLDDVYLAAFRDDETTDPPLLGAYSTDTTVYFFLPVARGLCFMNMLLHLIPHDKGPTFDRIAAQFIADPDQQYDRDDFLSVYQNVTQNQVFPTRNEINRFFDSWTYQRGYPILVCKRIGHRLHFSQHIQPVKADWKNTTAFHIPISIVIEPRAYLDENKTHPQIWLTPKDEEVTYEVRGVSKWVLVNNQRTGYYRVMYDEWNYKLLRFELVRGDLHKIPTVSRGHLLDDVMFMARKKKVRYDLALDMLEYLRRESEIAPWMSASRELSILDNNLRFTPAYELFKHLMKVLSRRLYRMNVEEAASHTENHPIAIKWACFGRLEHCLVTTNRMFVDFMERGVVVENLDTIVCVGVKLADANMFRYIILSVQTHLMETQRELYLRGLVCMENYRNLIEYLNVLMRRTSQLSWDVTTAMKTKLIMDMAQSSQQGARAVLDFTFQHPQLVFDTIGMAIRKLMHMLGMSIYKRSQQRKVSFLLRYLGIPRDDYVMQYLHEKRKWVQMHSVYIGYLMSNFEDIQVVSEYEAL